MPIATEGTLRTLAPVARDQVKLRDRVLRATCISAEQTYKGSSVVLQWEMGAYASFAVIIAGDSSSFGIDGSNDLNVWFPVEVKQVGTSTMPLAGLSFYQENSAVVGGIPTTVVVGNKQSKFVRVRGVSASSSRNSSVQVVLTQTPFAPGSPTRHFGSDQAWSYSSPTGGITNTTAIAIAAAINAYHRRVITQMEVTNGGTTGTEVLVSDSTAVVLWRGYLPPGGSSGPMRFDPPLRASANAAVNVTLSAASGAAVFVNARGINVLA